MRRLLSMGFILGLIAILVVGCGRPPEASVGASSQPPRGDEPVVTVEIKNFKFVPEEITIAPGTRVVFVNKDPSPHNVVEGTVQQAGDKNHKPLFASPELDLNESWEYVFTTEGTFSYICTVAGHYLMGMVGTIHVVEGAEQTAAAPADAPSHTSHAHHAHGAVASAAPRDLPDELIATPDGLVELQPFRVEGNVKEFAIDVQEVTHELLDGVVVTTWAFNGVMPGPTLRVTEGDVVRVHFTNNHHQPHTIHWHGIYADQEHDGVPHTSAEVFPGQTRVYEFVAEYPGTYWYHCHVDSYRHVDMGMYGALIIEPKGEKRWDREYTLVLDDWDSNIDPMASRYRPDFNYFIVNGKAFPEQPTLVMHVGETTRVRLINAGYNNFAMHLHGPHFQVVETDGRPLPAPYMKDTLNIAPGERYDIEVRPTKAGIYPFHAHNLQYVLNDGVYPGGIHLMVHIVDEDTSGEE